MPANQVSCCDGEQLSPANGSSQAADRLPEVPGLDWAGADGKMGPHMQVSRFGRADALSRFESLSENMRWSHLLNYLCNQVWAPDFCKRSRLG